MKNRVVCVAVMLMIMGSAIAEDAAIVNLRPEFVEGRSTRYEFWTQRDQDTRMSFNGNDQSFKLVMQWSGEIVWEVKKVRGDGSADCVMTFEWIAMSVTDPEGQTHESDTRKGPSDVPEMHAFLKAMVGKPLDVRMADDGSVEKVSGVKAITSANESAESLEARDFEETASYLVTLVSVPKQLEPGDDWPVDFTWGHELGELHVKTRYTLNDVGELGGIPVAMVSSESKLKLDFDKSDIPADAPPMDMKLLTGEQSEQIVFDLSRHEAVARNMLQTLNARMTVRLPQGSIVRELDEVVQGQVMRIEE